MKYEIISKEGYPIKIDNGRSIYINDRSGPIIGDFPDMLIVPMKVNNDDAENNFLGLNENGETVWKFNEGNRLGVKHSFTQPWVDNEANLWVKNLAGMEYQVDYKTGKVLTTKFENMDFEYNSNEIRLGGKKIPLPQEVKKITSWHGEVLLIFYGGSENSSFGYYLAAFNNKGEQLWTITNKDLGDSFSLYDGRFIRLMASEYTYDFDPRTGNITNKIHAR